jgi:hypothetical protein
MNGQVSSDWMLMCDSCGDKLPAEEEMRGSGEWGLEIVRRNAEADGWTCDYSQDSDSCPECSKELKP